MIQKTIVVRNPDELHFSISDAASAANFDSLLGKIMTKMVGR